MAGIRRFRHDDLENQLNKGALWAVTYGDMMSYLMIFFLLLFSFNVKSGAKKTGGEGKEAREYEESLISIQKVFGGKGSSASYERAVHREAEESMVSQLKETMDRNNLSQYAKIETWDKKIRLVLAEGVLFDSGTADLKVGSVSLLSLVAQQLRALPNPVVIEGHSDNVPVRGGRYSSNWELSMARAYSVLKYFENVGIAPSRLAGIGYGEHRPVADNATAKGRAMNRRIEIDLLRAD
ncbi:MAG: OmpA family protein [Elusimicrobia bacterium]|nr:OmpA family protein [Elusimicrobiota bacterium]